MTQAQSQNLLRGSAGVCEAGLRHGGIERNRAVSAGSWRHENCLHRVFWADYRSGCLVSLGEVQNQVLKDTVTMANAFLQQRSTKPNILVFSSC
jgi:hypothetical protein